MVLITIIIFLVSFFILGQTTKLPRNAATATLDFTLIGTMFASGAWMTIEIIKVLP